MFKIYGTMILKKDEFWSQALWCLFVIPALKRQSQEDGELGQPGIHGKTLSQTQNQKRWIWCINYTLINPV
jgi:hypothetical protein